MVTCGDITLNDPTNKYFPKWMSKRERAIFECGIALATIYHAFTGIPVKYDEEDIKRLERLIERSILAQPFRESVKIRIIPPKIEEKRPFKYFVLKGRNLEAEVTINYLGERVTGKMSYKSDLEYTLMYITE